MDAADRIILHTLLEDGRTPVKQLAEKVFLSSPAVSSRLDRLEKSGLIRSYQVNLDLKAMGYDMLAFINLSVLPDHHETAMDLIRRCINVLECHHVTGAYTLLLKTAFPGTKELEQFVTQLQQYGTTQTQVVFSTLIEPRQPLE